MGLRTKAELVPMYDGRVARPGDTAARVWSEQASLAAPVQVQGSTIPFYMIGQDSCGARDNSAITEMGCGVCWKGVNVGSSRGERTARERPGNQLEAPSSRNISSTLPSHPSRACCSSARLSSVPFLPQPSSPRVCKPQVWRQVCANCR